MPMIKFEKGQWVNIPTDDEVTDWHRRHPDPVIEPPGEPPPDVPWTSAWCNRGKHWIPIWYAIGSSFGAHSCREAK